MAIVNVPQSIAKANENIVTDSVRMETGGSSDVNVTTHAAEGDLAMLEQTEIYSIDFRTSSYKTFKEKMKEMELGLVDVWQDEKSHSWFSLDANLTERSSEVEFFDKIEYDRNNLENCIIKITPDYPHMQYYTEKIAPVLYDNVDVETIIGNYDAPNGSNVVLLNGYSLGFTLEPEDIQTGVHSAYISKYGAINNYMQFFMDQDLNKMLTKLANTHTNGKAVKQKEGVKRLLNTDCVPSFVRGTYPVLFKYQLPGKNTITSTYAIDVKY